MVTQTGVTKTLVCAVLLVGGGSVVLAQGGGASQAAEKPIIPLKVDVTLSRYEGEKKTENLPFTFLVNANGGVSTLNSGVRMPVPQGTTTPDGRTVSYTYQNVGTTFTLRAETLDDGRFSVAIDISDSSLAPTSDPQPGVSPPIFRSFSISNRVILRDGQSVEFVSSTDKVGGEVTKAAVAIAVVK